MPNPTTKQQVVATATPNNPWFAVSMVLIGLVAGYVIANGVNGFSGTAAQNVAQQPAAQQPAPPPPVEDSFPAPSEDDDMVLGEADAPVTIIEFSDFQCPFCRKFFREAYQDIKSEYVDNGDVKIVFRDLPLNFHPAAFPSAMAVECAADQSAAVGWAMHDAIFNEQDKQGQATVTYGDEELKEWAQGVSGLNFTRWETCYDDQTHEEEINKDASDANASGIDGTPGFWILGPDGQKKVISGAYPFSTFKTEIDAMLE